MEYNPEDMLDMTQQGGPYLQHTCLRIRRLLENLEKVHEAKEGVEQPVAESLSPQTKAVLLEVGRFPEILANATEDRAPHVLARYLYELCSGFNAVYAASNTEGRFLDMPPEQRAAYEKAFKAVLNVVTRGLSILNIDVPTIM